MTDLKAIISAVLIIALAVIISLHLILFWVNDGQFIIGEKNTAIRIIEAVLAAVILFFGIERLIGTIKNPSSSKTEETLHISLHDSSDEWINPIGESTYESEGIYGELASTEYLNEYHDSGESFINMKARMTKIEIDELIAQQRARSRVTVSEAMKRARSEIDDLFHRKLD